MKYLLSITVTLIALAGAAFAETARWNLATAYPDTEFHTKNIAIFAKDLEEATDGKIKITIHSGGSLYKMPQIRSAVQTRQVQAGEIIISYLANEDPLYEIDWLLYLVEGYDDARRLWEASRPAVEELFAKQNLKILFSVPWPPQNLFSKAEVRSVEDLKGVKMRVYNRATARIAELLNATPVMIEAAEMSQAFATGAVEALITSPSSAYNQHLYQFLNYGYNLQAALPKNVVFVNKGVFDRLEPELQAAVMDAAVAAEERGWKMSMAETDERIRQLREKGMTISDPTPQLKESLIAIGNTIAEEWLKSTGERGQKILDQYRQSSQK